MLHIDNKSACLYLCNSKQDGYLHVFHRIGVTAFQHGLHIVSIAVKIGLLSQSLSLFRASTLRPLEGDLLSL